MLLRNAYIGILDARINLISSPFTQTERTYLDLTKSPQDLQKYDPEIQQIIDSWKNDAATMMKEEDEIKLYQLRISRFQRLKANDPEKNKLRDSLRQELRDYFNKSNAKAIDEMNSPEVRIKTLMFAKYRIELLKVYEKEMFSQLEP